MIEVEHLTKRYGPHTAVNDISFRVERGQIVGFLGPNGAGKTTTMRILTCYQPASEGSARIAGYDIFDQPLEVKRRIGYLPELPPVYVDMKVRSYLDFAATIKGVSKRTRKGRIADVMDRCDISDRADQLIGQLSKGYRQRVGLAQAIVHNPDVIVLDEPTIGLDPNQVREVRKLIRSLSPDHTVILSTHILPEVEMTCDRVVIINKGRISAEDATDNLTSRSKGNERYYLEIAGEAQDAVRALREVPDVVEVTRSGDPQRDDVVRLFVDASMHRDIRADLAAKVVAEGLGLLELRRHEMSLEDIFHELTTSEEKA